MNEVAKLESGNSELMVSTATQGASELFVINLCASMTPMPAVPKNLKGFEKYKLYQVSRQEDGRRRFRLRLGFFTSEADAEWVLNSVRSLYPAAFTGCVTAEDLRYTGETVPAARVPVQSAPAALPPASPVTPTAVRPSAAPAKPATSSAKTAATNVNTATTAAPVPATIKPVAAAPTQVAARAPAQTTALTASTPAATPPQAPGAQVQSQPFHVGRGVELPETNLELTDEYQIPATLITPSKPAAQSVVQPAASAPRSAAPAASRSAASRSTSTAPISGTSNTGPIRSASIVSPPKVVDDYVPILDTTLTIRTLTKTEAEDPNRPKWYAVQLALSEQPINLDTMPKLDIFAAYTLYCVATMEGGTIKHALRLGFFRESVSAEAVMGYLKAFFNTPVLNQISAAEFERFSEPKPRPKPVPEAEAKVVDLNAKRPSVPAMPTAVQQSSAKTPAKSAASKPAAKDVRPRISVPPRPQSFLSRLIGRQLD